MVKTNIPLVKNLPYPRVIYIHTIYILKPSVPDRRKKLNSQNGGQ